MSSCNDNPKIKQRILLNNKEGPCEEVRSSCKESASAEKLKLENERWLPMLQNNATFIY